MKRDKAILDSHNCAFCASMHGGPIREDLESPPFSHCENEDGCRCLIEESVTEPLNDRTLRVLKNVEWVNMHIGFEIKRTCPVCFHDEPDHGLDCLLEMCVLELEDDIGELAKTAQLQNES